MMAIKLFIRICIVATLASILTACHTAQGFGEDLEAGGKAISKEAKKARQAD